MDIFVVEDSPSIRRLLVRRLEAMVGVRVVGEAAGQRQAFALIQWTRPALALVDLTLANGSGLALVCQLREAGFEGRIAVLTSQEGFRDACLNAGADAFYDKGTGLGTLFDDLDRMSHGKVGGTHARPAAQLRDGLSGLHDDLAQQECLAQAVRDACRDGAELAVYVLRLAALKALSADGAAAVAREVTRRLQSVGGAADIVPRGSPEQFVLVMTLRAADEAAEHARRLSHLMAAPFDVDGRATPLDVEIGMALFPAEAVSSRGLLTLAEASAFGAL